VRGQLAEGEGVKVTYREPTLVARDVTSGREVLRKDVRSFPCLRVVVANVAPSVPAPLAGHPRTTELLPLAEELRHYPLQ
jgi:hypothetical protein